MTYTPRRREYYIFFILSIHSLPISYRYFWRNFYALSIPIPLYSVQITLKDGRWMKLIRQCRDGKSEHYWPLDIINIPPDSATCTIKNTPWLNLSIMHKYMLQFTKMARKIILVSLGACLGPMSGMGTNYNRTSVLARPQTFRISVFKSP